MSIFKRLGNLGKGMWTVQTKGRDPGEDARIEALQEELARKQAEAGDLAASRLVDRPATSTSAAPPAAARTEAGHQRQLDALAESLRRGEIDRATYDARCEAIIARMDGAPEPAPARPDPGPAEQDDEPLERDDEGRVKRTL